MSAPADAEGVLDFWFGALDAQGKADAEHSRRWWRKDAAFDQEIRERFGALRESVLRGERDAWLASPRGRLAYVIVLDQFSRNLFRGRPEAFAGDARALAAALEGIDDGVDLELHEIERQFFYMPLMHSEDLAAQDRCVALFATFEDDGGQARDPAKPTYAERHRDIIRRFGRFPHRNDVLGRPSTEDELAFLKEPGSSF